MDTNLRKNKIVFTLCLFFAFLSGKDIRAQVCNQGLDFNFSSNGNSINWYQFPEFSLPFDIIYSGSTRVYDSNALLKRGFSQVSNPNGYSSLPKENKAYIYYNVAEGNQPWRTHKSPYGNDMSIYHKSWDDHLEWVKSFSGNNLDFDIFCLDIEMQHKSKDSILALKQLSFVPNDLKQLSDEAFVVQYQKDMQSLYAHAINYIKDKVNARIITSYGDVPVFNTFGNILGPTWSEWQSNPSLLNYIAYDFNNKRAGGEFYEAQDYLSPNAYFYYDYPHIFAGKYLSYLMFQIEANRAWSDKEQLLFIWNRYSFTPQFAGKNIKPWMAEAMAIFPFMSGAKGLWLWDDMTADINYSGYEHFMKGLYRLSKFKHYFEGTYELIQTISARDYDESKLPIWRGVYKDGKLFVAAHNPWATNENEETKISINYGSLNQTITLKGYEVFLCEFDADYVTGNEIQISQLQVYPNPSSGIVRYKISGINAAKIQLAITDELGKVLLTKEEDSLNASELSGEIDLSSLKNSKLIFSVQGGKFKASQNIILQK